MASQRNTPCLRSRLDSLDILLNEQPEGTVPDSDDLQSLPCPKDSSESSLKDCIDSVVMGDPNPRQPQRRPRHESVDSLDLLLDNQPEGILPDSADLPALIIPSSNKDLMSLPVHEQVEKNKSGRESENKTSKEDDIIKTTDDYEDIYTQTHLDLRLDTLLNDQLDGTVTESDSLPSTNVDLMSSTNNPHSVNMPDNENQMSDMREKKSPLDRLDHLLDNQAFVKESSQPDMLKSKPCPDSVDLLDIQPVDNRHPDKVSRQQDALNSESRLDSLDILINSQPVSNRLSEENRQPDILEPKSRLDSLDSMDILLDNQPLEKNSRQIDITEPKSRLDSLDSLDILLENQPLEQKSRQPDITEPKSRLDSLDILLENQPLEQKSRQPDIKELKSRLGSLDSMDILLDNQPLEKNSRQIDITEPKSRLDSLDSLDILLENQPLEQKSRQPDITEPKSRLDSLDILLENQPLEQKSRQPDIKELKSRLGSLDSMDILLDNQPLEKNSRQIDITEPKSRLDSLDSLDILLENQPLEQKSRQPDITEPKSRLDSLDSLDILLENQPLEQKSRQPDIKELKSRLGSLDSLDILLDNQPLHKDSSQTDNSKAAIIDQKTRLDSLDILLDNQPDGAVPDNDSLHSVMLSTKHEIKQLSCPAGGQSHVKDNIDHDIQHRPHYGGTHDCIETSTNQSDRDAMATSTVSLPHQPEGMGPVSEDLNSFSRPSMGVDLMCPPLFKESPTEKADPTEDIIGAPDNDESDLDDTEVNDSPVKPIQGKLKKRTMERSFEDLLNGLSDESEPELDEMILSDDNDNTNLESILVSPEQSKKQLPGKDLDAFSPPARLTSTGDDMDVLTSTPNTTKVTCPDVVAPSVEVKISAPDDDDDEFKSWEMVDRDEEGQALEDNDNDADEDIENVVMRNRNQSASNADSADDKDIDLSAIEDTNHLDVDINKHKSALGKKGSMALRRKQSRKSRRSVMATGEDAIFQDSTAPNSTDMMNGDDDHHNDKDTENYDMSPPAKKPSPSMMIPLPGMSGRPPPQRPTTTPDDIDDEPKPVRRVSKPPPGAFKLPDVMPRLSSKPSPEVPRKDIESTSHTFEKPALRSAKSSTVKDTGKETEPLFDTPVLRSVQGRDRERTSGSEERDVMFEKPALRSTPKPREQTPETKMETESGIFSKPSLRETPKKPIVDKKELTDTPIEPISNRNLRSTSKPGLSQIPSVEKHTFDKPKLRSTSRKESQDKTIEQDKDESSNMYERPALRSTKQQNEEGPLAETSESVSYKFDKPALRNTGLRNIESKRDTRNVGQFDKPALRKTPSPEKEVKPPSDPKGVFDKPSLRKTENSSNVSETNVRTDFKTNFPETKLRKTTSPQKEIVPEKPSWLKAAADKQSKALDVLQTKENTNNSLKKDLPSWLDKTPVLKGSRGQPLQDSSNGQSESNEDRKTTITPRSREPSFGSDQDQDKQKTSTTEFKTPQNNYVPSWMRQGRSPSTGGSGFVSPANSALADSDEVPQWKKDLAQRRSSRKEQSPILIDTPKREGSSEPEWKKNIQLRKTRPGDTPAKDKQSVEPEWKKAAEEKRARLRKSTVEN